MISTGYCITLWYTSLDKTLACQINKEQFMQELVIRMTGYKIPSFKIYLTLIVLLIATHAHAAGIWENYMANSRVNDILAHDNLVWVSRDDGLYRIDITDMSYVKIDNNSGFLAMDKDGTLWIVRNGIEILTFDGSRWQRQRISEYDKKFPDFGGTWVYIRDATFVDDTHLWIVTMQDILIYDTETQQTTIGPGYDDVGIDPKTMCVTENGDIWVGDFDLWHFDGETWTHYTTEKGLPFNYVNDIIAKGNIVLVNTSYGSFSFDGESFTVYDDSSYYEVFHEFAAVNGYSWYMGYELGMYDGDEFTHFASTGPIHNSLWSVGISPQGDVWFGTEKNGLYSIYDGNAWNHRTIIRQGHEQWINVISSIGFTSDNTPWLCTWSNRLYTLLNNQWVSYGEEKGWDPNFNDIVIDKSDGVWVANMHKLKHWDGSELVTWDVIDAFRDIPSHYYCNIRALDIAPDNTLWLGCDGGVLHFNGETFNRYITDDGLVSSYVKAVCAAADGSIWFGTDDGVSHFNGTEWVNYTVDDGLSHNSITSIAIGHDRTVWFGTEYGLSSLNDSGIETFAVENGLVNNNIRDLVVHPDGSLWIATAGGASHYIPETATVVANLNEVPGVISITSNYPNPFNLETTISFTLPSQDMINLSIYNSMGQKVRDLISENMQAGKHAVVWNGRNNIGEAVSSGLYISRLENSNTIMSNKMLLLK